MLLCYSALTKYDAIKEQISKINSVLSSKLTTTATTVKINIKQYLGKTMHCAGTR